MSQTISAPATFGQLSVLRQHAHPGNGGRFPTNQAYACELPPGTSLIQVNEAWRRVVHDNEALRTNFDLNAPRPLQLIHPPDGEVRLSYHDLAGGGIDAAYDHAGELAATPFAIGSESPVRAFIGLESGWPTQLGFAIHHAAADHAGCLNIERQLQAALRGEAVEPPAQPSALAHDQQRNLKHHDQAIEYWARRWPGFSTGDHTSSPAEQRYRAHLYSRPAMQAANAVAADLRVSVQSVVLAITSVVAGRLMEQQDLTVGLASGNRHDPRWSRTVTSMYQMAPVLITVDPALSPAAFLRETYLNSSEAYMMGLYDVDGLQARLIADGMARPSLLFDNCYSFLNEAGDDVPDDHLWSHSVEVRPLPNRVWPRVGFLFATGAGMHIQIRAGERYAPPDRLGVLAASIEAGLIGLAKRQPSTLGELSIEPLRGVCRT